MTDGVNYPVKNGIVCENLWILDRIHGGFNSSSIVDKYCRTATADDSIVYVGKSSDCTIQQFNILTGDYIGEIQCKLNGVPYSETLGLNQIGFDDYGHLYIATFAENLKGDSYYSVFLCNKFNGELTLLKNISFGGIAGRVDHCDVYGDLTGEKSNGAIIAGCSRNINIFYWKLSQGSTNWVGGWAGTPGKIVNKTYPLNTTDFSYSCVAKFVKSELINGYPKYVIIDGFSIYPSLYDISGNTPILSQSYEQVNYDKTLNGVFYKGKTILPDMATNGAIICNKKLTGKNIFICSEGQYDKPHSCQVIINLLDNINDWSTMTQLWMLPEDGMGNVSDGGNRVHSLCCVDLPVSSNGKYAFLLIDFKCYNGLAVYKIFEEGYTKPKYGETLKEKLDYLSTTKNIIRAEILAKGINILENTPFREYANKIRQIGYNAATMSVNSYKLPPKTKMANSTFESIPESTNFEEIGPDWSNMFYNCKDLKSISYINATNISNMDNMITGCINLSYINIVNFGKHPQLINLDASSCPWGDDSIVHDSLESLKNSLIFNSFDRQTAGYSSCNIKLSEKTKSLLTNEEKNAIASKGYILR